MSPLATEEYVDLTEIEKDFQRLAKLTNGSIRYVHLLGGEPLLHPQIGEICVIARKCFSCGEINVITKGLKIKHMDNSFWDVCIKNDICIAITQYPVSYDYMGAKEYLKSMGVSTKNFFAVHLMKMGGTILKIIFKNVEWVTIVCF